MRQSPSVGSYYSFCLRESWHVDGKEEKSSIVRFSNTLVLERFVNNFYLLSLSVVPARYVDTPSTVSLGSKFPDTDSSSLIQADADG